MTEVQLLELKLETVETVLAFLQEQTDIFRKQHENLTMELNRARRIERELQK